MKRRLFTMIALLPFLLPVDSYPKSFTHCKTEKIDRAFYFTPAASSRQFAIFGYMAKITPTPEEIEAERKRISAIIDHSVEQGYGSWENFEKEMKRAGEEIASEMERQERSRLQALMPPSLVKEAVPLLMKGALLLAKTHPEMMREPVGNLGETGIIIVDSGGNTTKIPIGINAPVTSIAISPDNRRAAILTDMSYEDESGRLHPVGEISLIDLVGKRRIKSWIFSNLAGHLALVPSMPDMLALDLLVDMKDFGKKELVFLDLKTGRINAKHHFPINGQGSASIFGKDIDYPGFYFSPCRPVVALYSKGFFVIKDILTGERLLKVKANGHILAFAHNHPLLFTGIGELWDFDKKRIIASITPRIKGFPFSHATFTKDDDSLLYLNGRTLSRFHIGSRRDVAVSKGIGGMAGLFFLTPDGDYLISFIPQGGLTGYKGRHLRRQRLCLRIFRTEDLSPCQDICINGSTVVDAAMAGDILAISDFERLHIYRKIREQVSLQASEAKAEKSLLAEIEKEPAAFAGKTIQLDGWAWHWTTGPPKEIGGRIPPHARNNYGSRSDGTFTDGARSVLYPVPPGFSGPFKLRARVVMRPYGWQLVPADRAR